MKITNITARSIIDSRGMPTVEADVLLDDGALGRAAVPSGASTGSGEALELRDGGEAFGGKGVAKAVVNVAEKIAPALVGHDPQDQTAIDRIMIDLDGTENKNKLGANAILAVSMAVAKAAAAARKEPLYKYIAEKAGNNRRFLLPAPLMNVINGGKHAAGSTDIQEFMIIPRGSHTKERCFKENMAIGVEVFMALKKELEARGLSTTVGDEGGFAPAVKGNEEALQLLVAAIGRTKYQLEKDVVFALDVAATELMTADGKYELKTENKTLSSTEMVAWYKDLSTRYPIVSIEDGLGENDWDGWQQLTAKLGNKLQLVGDDLLVTNTRPLKKAINQKAANTILIKPNQIGTLTETFMAVELAHQNNWNAIMSHRSGETEDTTIAHLAVGLGCAQIKTGSLSRSERLAKYNELIRIEEQLFPDAT